MNTLELARTRKGRQVRLALPIEAVLKRVPGKTVTEKAKRIGISRQAYYTWLTGRARPSEEQAYRLAEITKLSASKIRGWVVKVET